MTVYAVNGLGRIGKLILRPLLETGAEIAFLNDSVGTPEMHAHLLEFDTVHGRWDADFSQNIGSCVPFTVIDVSSCEKSASQRP